MSIDRIGPKVMLHKATEFAKDASAELKRNELAHDAMQKKLQSDAERQAKEVVQVNKAENLIIQREQEKKKRQEQKEKEEKKRAKQPTIETDPKKARTKLPEVSASEQKIDIRV